MKRHQKAICAINNKALTKSLAKLEIKREGRTLASQAPNIPAHFRKTLKAAPETRYNKIEGGGREGGGGRRVERGR